MTYEYAGRQYTVQMPYDPGPTVRLQVSPVGAADYGNVNAAQGQVVTAPAVQAVVSPAIVAPPPPAQVVYSGYPYPYAYPAPVYRPYYPPISLSFGYVWGGGHRHHRHWR